MVLVNVSTYASFDSTELDVSLSCLREAYGVMKNVAVEIKLLFLHVKQFSKHISS